MVLAAINEMRIRELGLLPLLPALPQIFEKARMCETTGTGPSPLPVFSPSSPPGGLVFHSGYRMYTPSGVGVVQFRFQEKLKK